MNSFVTHIGVFDRRGGACIVVYRQHQGLVAAGVDSRMWVRFKETADSRISTYSPPPFLRDRTKRVLRRMRLARESAKAGKPANFSTTVQSSVATNKRNFHIVML